MSTILIETALTFKSSTEPTQQCQNGKPIVAIRRIVSIPGEPFYSLCATPLGNTVLITSFCSAVVQHLETSSVLQNQHRSPVISYFQALTVNKYVPYASTK